MWKIPRPQLFACLLTLVVASCTQPNNGNLVRNIDEFNAAVATLQPGDKVVLANGTWTDVELQLKGEGLADQPIELTAEEPGKVIITGQSNLRISGSHIVVSGLVFKDGFTPTSEVIFFSNIQERSRQQHRRHQCRD